MTNGILILVAVLIVVAVIIRALCSSSDTKAFDLKSNTD